MPKLNGIEFHESVFGKLEKEKYTRDPEWKAIIFPSAVTCALSGLGLYVWKRDTKLTDGSEGEVGTGLLYTRLARAFYIKHFFRGGCFMHGGKPGGTEKNEEACESL